MAAPLTPDASSVSLLGRIVLVVEDDYFIAEEICAALRARGAVVVGPAPDVDQGRALMYRQQLDCAVLDVNLHGEQAFSLAGELQSRGVPSIFATGYDAGFLPTHFRDSGYLQKPIEISALIRAVEKSSRAKRARHN